MVKVKKWSRRVVWMVAIWCASVLLLAGVGMLFRLLMTSAGFRSWLIPPGRAFVSRESAFLSTDRRLSITFARLISPLNSG